jgi:hypothetical protein
MDIAQPGLSRCRGANGLALFLVSAWLALAVWSTGCRAQDGVEPEGNLERRDKVGSDGRSARSGAELSAPELEGLQRDDLKVESYYCSCYDKPNKHFPYAIVVLRTPQGDLVARPERNEAAVTFTVLAIRYGNRYCEVDVGGDCYGSFAEPCDFTDFRYGPTLAEFFPTCMSD